MSSFDEVVNQIHGFTVVELKNLSMMLPSLISKKEAETRQALRNEIEKFANERGFKLSDLVSEKNTGDRVRKPVKIKYRHPADATLTWSGRGRQPKWVVAYLENGGLLEQLSI